MTSTDQNAQPSWMSQWAPTEGAPAPENDFAAAAAEHSPADAAAPEGWYGAPTASTEEPPYTTDIPVETVQEFRTHQHQQPAPRALRPVPPVAPAPAPPAPAPVTPFLEPGGDTKLPPTAGLRRMVFDVSGGSVNMGRSKADVRRDALCDRMNISPGELGYKIAVVTIKGGAGKTTSASTILTALGMNAAATRVLGVDANPATGTLKERLDSPSSYDIRHILADKNLFEVDENGELQAAPKATYPGLTHYTGKSKANFEVIQGSENIAAAHQLTAGEYNALLDVAQQFCPIIVTDCGTELHHDVTRAALTRADMVVIVAGTAKGTVKKAEQTLNFLHNYPSDDLDETIPLKDENGKDIATFRHLLSRCVVVINDTGQRGKFRVPQLKRDFFQVIQGYHEQEDPYQREQLTAQVLELPFDKHLAADGPIVYDLLSKKTQWAVLELAATIGDDFPRAADRRRRAAAASGARR